MAPAISTKSDKSAPLISHDDLMEALYMNPVNSLGDLFLFTEIKSGRENSTNAKFFFKNNYRDKYKLVSSYYFPGRNFL